jgi:DNA segregation ATPase FtsK/SpoIIIE, S-DNA-T family
MRRVAVGDELAQLANRDAFAVPSWRSPVFRTPLFFVFVVQVVRDVVRLTRFLFRHPIAVTAVVAGAGLWHVIGWQGVAAVALALVVVLAVWRVCWPVSFARFVAGPARAWRRKRYYRRRWAAVMTIGRLAPAYQGRMLMPVIGKVTATRYTDRVAVKLVSGQSAADFTDRIENLAHGFGAVLCRVRAARPGSLVLEFVRRDALAVPIPALPISVAVDLRALPVGRREDGQPWLVRLHGTHLLVAGATGAGKGSILWSLVRAMLPLMAAGLVRVWAADPKLMELAFGRALFDRYGRYAATPEDIAVMLEDAVAQMQATAAKFAGKQRSHTPTAEHPFTVIMVDEVAFLTAYQTDRKLRERILAALATLTTQGRAVGYCVVAALQDPRKEVLNLRNLFPDRIAMRLDEPEQVDMVLGDGSRDRGALADLIPVTPQTGAGTAYVRLETDPEPVRVRAGWVTDPDIHAMTADYAPGHGWQREEEGEAA